MNITITRVIQKGVAVELPFIGMIVLQEPKVIGFDMEVGFCKMHETVFVGIVKRAVDTVTSRAPEDVCVNCLIGQVISQIEYIIENIPTKCSIQINNRFTSAI